MSQRLTTTVSAIASLAFVVPLSAHHSISMFDISAPIWVKGVVVSYVPVNPHPMITLEQTRDDGQVQRWIVEGPTLARLNRMRIVDAASVKVGDVIEVCGFGLKEEVAARRPYAVTAGARPFVHGHLLVMPNGRAQPWGPYGKFDNCVRPGDQTASWAGLLNKDPIARDLWCAKHRASVPARADSQALIAEIDGLMAHPCDLLL